jgi:glycerol kinase
MKSQYVIAFDQGTTSTRAIIFDKNGDIHGIAQKELNQYHPKSGWVEQDPEEIFADQNQVFHELIDRHDIDVEEIAGIGITNQRETTVVWDAATGKPIYNAIVWLDKRSSDICDKIIEEGHEEYIIKSTGLKVDAYFSGTKFRWILENVPEAKDLAEKGRLRFGTVDTWLIWKFTDGKKHLTDHTNASRTLLYNIHDLEWDDKLSDILSIPKSALPKVQNSASDFGFATYKDKKIPILGVAGDQQAALFGQGGFKSGIAKNTYGTGCFMLLNTGKKANISSNGLLTTLTCTLPGDKVKYALEGSVFVAGASVQWLRDKMDFIDKASETEEICHQTDIDPSLYVVPAFAGLGAPHWDMKARGSIFGLTLDTCKNAITKATIQSIAYQIRDVLEAMIEDSGQQMKTLSVDGGASANNYLMQFQSDILNVEVERPKMLEVTAMGAAFLAGIQAGIWTKEDIVNIRNIDKVFEPQMDQFERTKLYDGWKLAVERTKTAHTNQLAVREDMPIRFSVLDRKPLLHQVKHTKYDILIIGGGVTGAGIALDAASRGLKTCLIEKNDFASGTSNKSTKLIHGGLRYLKQMEIGLVKESGSERAIVHNLVPHLVVPEKMLLPLIEGGTYGKTMTSIGLKVYDLLANVEGDDKRKMLSADETLSKEPLLNKEHLKGGGYYAEYRTDDARLTIELLKKASAFGADILNYCEMKNFVYKNNGKIKHVVCKDHNTGEAFIIKSKAYISAAGPWVDKVRTKDTSLNNKRLHLTKGVHLVFSKARFPLSQSIYFDVPDGRMIFAIPRGRATYVGTTDTTYKGDLNRVVATEDDANYLIDAVNNMFPDLNLTIEDIESNWAGLRPLIHEDGKDPSDLSRKDEIFVSDSGLVSIAGGKLTGYRKMAQRTIDEALKQFKKKKLKAIKDSTTKRIQLTSEPLKDLKAVNQYRITLEHRLKDLGVEDPYQAWYYTSNYGKQSDIILKKMNYFINPTPIERLIRAELWYTVHHEMVNGLSDFFVRRTGRLYFDIESVHQFRHIVEEDLIKYLKWDEARCQRENKYLDMLLADATTYYEKEFGEA